MEQIIKIVEKIIKKYLNVNQNDCTCDGNVIEFDLNDYLDKPGNFESDIENILFDMDKMIPTGYIFTHKYYTVTLWNGEEDIEQYNCKITIKKVGE